MKNRRQISILLAVLIVFGGFLGGWAFFQKEPKEDIILYGNVDFRQASIAFNGTERIADILAEEGDQVKKGQVLAILDTSRLKPLVEQAEAQVSAQKAVLLELKNGSRPEEIAQARAKVASAQAEEANYRFQFERKQALMRSANTSRQDYDDAKTKADMASAQVREAQSALDLKIAGPRSETIQQAEAQLRGYEAQLAIVQKQLTDAQLVAPFDGIVRTRLMEPGEMASTAKPVFSIASSGTKWVRAYIPETDLGHVKIGMKASVQIDSFPKNPLNGWVGFISPVAEFTPKTVQTTELRSSLVYEIRIFAKDPDNILRLGMPATVMIQNRQETMHP